MGWPGRANCRGVCLPWSCPGPYPAGGHGHGPQGGCRQQSAQPCAPCGACVAHPTHGDGVNQPGDHGGGQHGLSPGHELSQRERERCRAARRDGIPSRSSGQGTRSHRQTVTPVELVGFHGCPGLRGKAGQMQVRGIGNAPVWVDPSAGWHSRWGFAGLLGPSENRCSPSQKRRSPNGPGGYSTFIEKYSRLICAVLQRIANFKPDLQQIAVDGLRSVPCGLSAAGIKKRAVARFKV